MRPKQPFLDWVRAVDDDDAPEVTLDQMDATLYLVPDYDDPADADKVLKKVGEEIFCRELEGWYTDGDVWPKDRSLKVFKLWFDVQHDEVVEDVGRGLRKNAKDRMRGTASAWWCRDRIPGSASRAGKHGTKSK